MFKDVGAIPFAGACTDPCDGRSQGTTAMFDSLPLSQRRGDDIPAADSIAADAARRARRRDLRQGAAGDDDGAGGDAAICRASWCPAASRCLPDGGRGCRRGYRPSACASRTATSRWSRPPISGCHDVRIARRRLPVSGHRRDLAGGRRSARHVAGTLRAGAVRPPDLAGHGAPIGARADGARRARHDDARHPHRRVHAQRAW